MNHLNHPLSQPGSELTSKEKEALWLAVKNRINRGVVTKPADRRYNIWRIYKLNTRGVIMGFIPWIIIGLLAIGGGTAAVADNAVPGDALYNLDQAIERWQEKFATSDNWKANLFNKLSEERLAEWQALQNIDPSTLTSRAKELWEQHNEAAAERLAASIERLNELQARFEEKMAAAEGENQKAAFQRIIDQLNKVEGRRAERLEEIKDREFPGLRAVIKREARLRIWQELSKAERQALKQELKDRDAEDDED
ncbi:MAG: hypothetical protein VE96_C0006G0001, partial [candidate division Kazan bacterium GW2011_GWA1_44_22]